MMPHAALRHENHVDWSVVLVVGRETAFLAGGKFFSSLSIRKHHNVPVSWMATDMVTWIDLFELIPAEDQWM